MKPITTSLAVIFLNLLVSDCCAQKLQDSPKLTSEIQFVLDSLQKTNGFPGATLSVILPDNKQLNLATGFADPMNAAAMTPNHRMLSGSNGKTLFIAAALVLASQEYYQLDDKIEKYLGSEKWFFSIAQCK